MPRGSQHEGRDQPRHTQLQHPVEQIKTGGGGDSVAQERDGGTPEFLSKGRDREHSEEGEGEPHHPGRERRDKMEGIHRQELVRV